MILVTGATGNVGRHVVGGLTAAGHEVRPFSRSSGGSLFDPDALTAAVADVDTVFLLWPGPLAEGVDKVVEILAGPARKIVYLSAMSAEAGFWGVVENAVSATGVGWTFLRAGGFATNTLGWAPMIRADGAVRWPYGEAARSLIHEKDLADVAVHALLTDDLTGQRPVLTGPADVTQADQVRQIGEAIGRELRWVELPPDEARRQLTAEWGDESFADAALAHWASLVGRGEPVTHEVERITGHPARAFRTWAEDHAADFR